jgi:hypothetical protein
MFWYQQKWMLIIGVLILLILFVALAFVVTNNCNDGNDGHDHHHNCDDSSSDDCPIDRHPIDDCNNSSLQNDASSGFAEKSSKPPGWYARNHRKH